MNFGLIINNNKLIVKRLSIRPLRDN